ncbi:MBL fold metallo-hydrolase [Cyanobium sp. FGCU-6]|jgi:alkyl sulfatase BDS1-like metallo-beta-lactamase superfamily hydrolase|nr:MBL fold metallo-hydrolase [Cyanobium sp. FGCU6]
MTDADQAATVMQHFDAKGKLPSSATIEFQKALRRSLPFEDQRDFEEAQRGFIAAPDYRQIMAEAGNVAWDMGCYNFLLRGFDSVFDSIHPSLQRQAVLNMAYGLYEVLPERIYQIRGFDLANMTIIKGETGWILFDVLTCKETARAALDFVNQQLGERSVVAVVYSHSHVDHFGGVRGVTTEEDVKCGKVRILAPAEFMKHAIAENIYTGTAMTRRAFYQYGLLLPRSPYGHVDQSIGKNAAAGKTGLIEPSTSITQEIEEITIDGVRMVFQNTPGTEAPAEMNTYFPDWKAFWAAENICGTIHNIYTLRGALVRDALEWSKKISEALYLFGQEAEVMFASHSWPRWGNERIQEVMRTQRDAYAHLHNEVLHQANKGVTINEIHNIYQQPESLKKQWAARSYHGSEEHNSRAVINRYLGYWDANPATLIPLSPAESAPLYVEMMGGAERIIAKGQELFEQAKYLSAIEILNKLVYAEPRNQSAKDLLADAFEQVGYQKESPSVRNSFLAAAFELRQGFPSGVTAQPVSPDTVKAMTTDLLLDYLGIRLDSRKAAGMAFTINLLTPDNGEQFILELRNSTLSNCKGFQSPAADLSIEMNRSDLELIMSGQTTFPALVGEGKVKLEGDASLVQQLQDLLVQFSPEFEIMPGTLPAMPPKAGDRDLFEQPEPSSTAGG